MYDTGGVIIISLQYWQITSVLISISSLCWTTKPQSNLYKHLKMCINIKITGWSFSSVVLWLEMFHGIPTRLDSVTVHLHDVSDLWNVYKLVHKPLAVHFGQDSSLIVIPGQGKPSVKCYLSSIYIWINSVKLTWELYPWSRSSCRACSCAAPRAWTRPCCPPAWRCPSPCCSTWWTWDSSLYPVTVLVQIIVTRVTNLTWSSLSRNSHR